MKDASNGGWFRFSRQFDSPDGRPHVHNAHNIDRMDTMSDVDIAEELAPTYMKLVHNLSPLTCPDCLLTVGHLPFQVAPKLVRYTIQYMTLKPSTGRYCRILVTKCQSTWP